MQGVSSREGSHFLDKNVSEQNVHSAGQDSNSKSAMFSHTNTRFKSSIALPLWPFELWRS